MTTQTSLPGTKSILRLTMSPRLTVHGGPVIPSQRNFNFLPFGISIRRRRQPTISILSIDLTSPSEKKIKIIIRVILYVF